MHNADRVMTRRDLTTTEMQTMAITPGMVTGDNISKLSARVSFKGIAKVINVMAMAVDATTEGGLTGVGFPGSG
jgi:hypothetical protein